MFFNVLGAARAPEGGFGLCFFMFSGPPRPRVVDFVYVFLRFRGRPGTGLWIWFTFFDVPAPGGGFSLCF